MLSLTGETANAQHSSYEELQAAYIYNFAKYIKWPDEKPTFVIGVYDDSEIIEFLKKTLEGKKVGIREIELKIISRSDAFTDCNIIYVSQSDSRKVEELAKAVAGKSILIVTEDDLIKKGAAISFVVEDDRLRFKIKKSVLTEAGLLASEGLLKLAISL
jgi:hypothetical protein